MEFQAWITSSNEEKLFLVNLPDSVIEKNDDLELPTSATVIISTNNEGEKNE